MRTIIRDNFDNPQGRFVNYDTYDQETNTALAGQSHVDLRSFSDTEEWTNTGTSSFDIGPSASRNNVPSLTAQISVNTTAVLSSVPGYPIDLNEGFEDDSFVTIALPDYDADNINETDSYLVLTSNPDGDFTIGPTVLVSFASSITPVINGNTELRWPRTALTGIDLSAITGVRLSVQNISLTNTVTFHVTGLRLISPTWQHASLDLDTQRDVVRAPVPLDGGETLPDLNLSILWRSHSLSGESAPRPIDAAIAVAFNTGSRTQTNRLVVYMRENTIDWWDQNDLNGMTMAELKALGRQPNMGGPMWEERTQDDLSQYTQDELQGLTQYDLSRVPDHEAASHISFQLVWDPTVEFITVTDVEGNSFSEQDISILEPNTDYLLIAEAQDRHGRMRIQSLNPDGSVIKTVYDTGQIMDDFLFKRIKGRIGWMADLQDGDAYIEYFRPRSLGFAEYRSRSLTSITPVEGARLYVEASNDDQLYTGITSKGNGVILMEDEARTTSGQSTKITLDGTETDQGVSTNVINFEDFGNTEFSFDIYHTGLFERGGLQVALVNDKGYYVPLETGLTFADQWQSVRITLIPAREIPPGPYQIEFSLPDTGTPETFWLDKISVRQRTIEWTGRSVDEDPWGDHSAEWINFEHVTNSRENGVLFPERGHVLQVRGRALTQDAFISRVRILPKYAELGNFVWPDQIVSSPAPTANGVITPVAGRTYDFSGTGSTASGAALIINYHWYFGDGYEGDGENITHTFIDPGNYRATLTVTDSYGAQDTFEEILNVS